MVYFRWILDTHHELLCNEHERETGNWPDEDEPEPDAALARQALQLLTPEESAKVLRHHWRKDAALALGSQLLRRLAVVKACGVSWQDSACESRVEVRNGKPFYAVGGVEFNISHHGQLVVLAASTEPLVQLGIDVVHVDLERDHAAVERAGGMEQWLETFAEVFSHDEIRSVLRDDSTPSGSTDQLFNRRMRHFYALWACKEAYLKMTGDGLATESARDIEFAIPRVPEPPFVSAPEQSWIASQPIRVTTIPKKPSMQHACIDLQSLGADYLVVTASSIDQPTPELELLCLSEAISRVVSESSQT